MVGQNLSVGRTQHCNVRHGICEQALGPYRCRFADPSQQRLISALSLVRRRITWGKERQAVRRGDDDGDVGACSIPGLFPRHEAAAISHLVTARFRRSKMRELAGNMAAPIKQPLRRLNPKLAPGDLKAWHYVTLSSAIDPSRAHQQRAPRPRAQSDTARVWQAGQHSPSPRPARAHRTCD